MTEGSTVLSRMVDELTGLEEKFSKLDTFIMSEHFEKLQKIERLDLCEQHRHMEQYAAVLKRRINRMTSVVEDV